MQYSTTTQCTYSTVFHKHMQCNMHNTGMLLITHNMQQAFGCHSVLHKHSSFKDNQNKRQVKAIYLDSAPYSIIFV